MSVVVWDGKSLACDRGVTDGVTLWEYAKLRMFKDYAIAGIGNQTDVKRLMDWYVAGAHPAAYPTGISSADIFVARGNTLYHFEKSPYPLHYGDTKVAFGTGKDFAFGALAMGATAAQAVEVACKFSTTCGHGVDVYEALASA